MKHHKTIIVALVALGCSLMGASLAESCYLSTSGKITCKDKPKQTCTSGEVLNSSGKCVSKTCPSGEALDPSNNCVLSASAAEAGCSAGKARKTLGGTCQTYQGTSCIKDNAECTIVW